MRGGACAECAGADSVRKAERGGRKFGGCARPFIGGGRMYSRPEDYTLSRTRRQVILVGLMTVSASLAGCGDQGALDGLSAGQTGRVTAVLSGDRVELDGGETVDLAGV